MLIKFGFRRTNSNFMQLLKGFVIHVILRSNLISSFVESLELLKVSPEESFFVEPKMGDSHFVLG